MYFKAVDYLVAVAPHFFDWEILSLKPAVFSHFTAQLEDLQLDSKEMWFLPLSYVPGPDLNIRVCLKDYDRIKNSNALTPLLHKMIATIVGERAFALDINYVYTDLLPEQPDQCGLWSILELSEYVDWFKSTQRTRPD